MPENIVRITTNEDLKRGEYALVFRKKDASGAYTTNVPLKPAPRQPSAPAAAQPGAGVPGMTPEMMGGMTPEQIQLMQQTQQGQTQTAPRGGMFGIGRRAPSAPPAPAPGAAASTAGFLAWDFRVLP
jgi:hypothetical protein